jgi:hypothetical protein
MSRHLVAAFLVLAIAPVASATDYYVAPGGSNAASGLTPGTAWATLQYAADTVVAGDTVHVADGNYAGFDIRKDGTGDDPITFVATGAAAAITSENPETPDGINIENASYIVVDGFISSGHTRAGMRAALSHHITFRNNTCGDNGVWGIFTGFVDDLLIENNETYGSIDEHGIYVSNSGDRPVIRGNHSHDNNANGIHMNGDESQGGDGLISEALVEDNVIHGNGVGGGSGINMDGVTDSVVRNNLLYDNHASGISMYRIDGATGSTGNLVINNTILSASDGRWCINVSDSPNNTIRNNILYTYHSFRGVIVIDGPSATGFSSDYNSLMDRMSPDGDATIFDLAEWQDLGYDLHSFVATPAQHFVAPGSDFHLLLTSPAIDEGTSVDAPGDDIEGSARPVGAGVDIGAYEAQLLFCGDGNVDTGEVCGEPGLPGCADPCTTCSGCVCAPADPVCGDTLVCGAEQCEDDGDCGGGQVCSGCECVNPPVCESGLVFERPRLKARAAPFRISFRAEAVVPKPWAGINPPASGVRFVLDSTSGAGGLDATIPGGALWKTNGSGTTWSYTDSTGAVSGITKVVVKDRSSVEDGRVRISVKAKSDTGPTLPDASAVRTTMVLGTADECAAVEWNGPDEAPPACDGSPAQLSCR